MSVKILCVYCRKEIWIRPEGGGRRLHRTTSAQEEAPDSDEVELRDLSTTDLNRRFNNTFLYLIGKLYTNINMDTFSLAAELLQKEFRVLLSRSPLPIDSKRLVQIMALNMFVIEHTKVRICVHLTKLFSSCIPKQGLRNTRDFHKNARFSIKTGKH